MSADRYARRYGSTAPRAEDKRKEGQRDRDRLLYTSAFRRLAGITQVVAPAEGNVFHNRLTHTLEVAQIGRRLAERLIQKHNEDFINDIGGLDSEVVEAAAMAHDLGHPPFGHIAERTLCELLDDNDIELKDGFKKDGFEGNAQSFRIVTKLAVRYQERDNGIVGLNLCRATLNAIAKYPWERNQNPDNRKKWGVYSSERDDLAFAREDPQPDDYNRTAEAELMDWADDVAYAVHDLEDFYRANLIPLNRLILVDDERQQFLESAFERLGVEAETDKNRLGALFEKTITWLPTIEQYQGTTAQRAALRGSTSFFINRYIDALDLVDPKDNSGKTVRIDQVLEEEVRLLKELTWHYVIQNPSLRTQQHGQQEVIRGLFARYSDAAKKRDYQMFPAGYQEEFERQQREGAGPGERARTIADYIASMTEQQALKMYGRITGTSLGSVLDPSALQ